MKIPLLFCLALGVFVASFPCASAELVLVAAGRENEAEALARRALEIAVWQERCRAFQQVVTVAPGRSQTVAGRAVGSHQEARQVAAEAADGELRLVVWGRLVPGATSQVLETFLTLPAGSAPDWSVKLEDQVLTTPTMNLVHELGRAEIDSKTIADKLRSPFRQASRPRPAVGPLGCRGADAVVQAFPDLPLRSDLAPFEPQLVTFIAAIWTVLDSHLPAADYLLEGLFDAKAPRLSFSLQLEIARIYGWTRQIAGDPAYLGILDDTLERNPLSMLSSRMAILAAAQELAQALKQGDRDSIRKKRDRLRLLLSRQKNVLPATFYTPATRIEKRVEERVRLENTAPTVLQGQPGMSSWGWLKVEYEGGPGDEFWREIRHRADWSLTLPNGKVQSGQGLPVWGQPQMTIIGRHELKVNLDGKPHWVGSFDLIGEGLAIFTLLKSGGVQTN